MSGGCGEIGKVRDQCEIRPHWPRFQAEKATSGQRARAASQEGTGLEVKEPERQTAPLK